MTGTRLWGVFTCCSVLHRTAHHDVMFARLPVFAGVQVAVKTSVRDDDFDETLELFELEARMAWRAANFNGGRAGPSSGHLVHTHGVRDTGTD